MISRDRPWVKKDLKAVSMFMCFTLIAVVFLQIPYIGSHEIISAEYFREGDGEDGPVMIETAVFSQTGYTQESSTTEETFSIDQEVVTSVQVILTWNDDLGNNDVFKLSVILDDNEIASGEDSSGQITVIIKDEELGALFGNYSVKITAVDCPGLIGPIPVDRDNGNSWDLEVKATVSEDQGGGG